MPVPFVVVLQTPLDSAAVAAVLLGVVVQIALEIAAVVARGDTVVRVSLELPAVAAAANTSTRCTDSSPRSSRPKAPAPAFTTIAATKTCATPAQTSATTAAISKKMWMTTPSGTAATGAISSAARGT